MKKIICILLVAVLAVSFALASGSKAKDGGSGSSKGAPLIVYSNSVSDGRGDWLVERAKKDGFNIQYLDAGAAAVQQRLIAEKNAPIADVVFGLNTILWESLVSEDVLEPYRPVWADEVDQALNDPNGENYHAIVKQGIFIVYDKNQVDPKDAPKDWPELWQNPEYWGRYEFMIALTGGTVRTVLAGIFTRYLDPNGYLGVSDEGWKQIEEYYKRGVPAESDKENLYARLSDHNEPIVFGQMWSSGIEARDEQYGTDTGYVIPDCGIPYAVEGVAIVKGTKNLEEAKRFVDWFGSAEIQAEWAKEFSTLPANVNAAYAANDFNRELANIPAQDIDWKTVAANIDKWCEEIQLKYLP